VCVASPLWPAGAERRQLKELIIQRASLNYSECPGKNSPQRLERQLKRRGWQWIDYGPKFAINHKLPVRAFNLKKAEERARCTHRSNLQVLPAEWNRAKNGYFPKDLLQAYKTIWRLAYDPKPKQLKFDAPF
jgi:hypothetical protein